MTYRKYMYSAILNPILPVFVSAFLHARILPLTMTESYSVQGRDYSSQTWTGLTLLNAF